MRRPAAPLMWRGSALQYTNIGPFRHHLLYAFVHVGHVETAWRELGETGAEQP